VARAGLVVGVTGTTGHLGGLLLRRLLADPLAVEVRSVARRPLSVDSPAQLASHARLVHTEADLQEPAARRALEGADLVYHLGAQVWRGRGPGALERMYGTNVEGTRNVLAAKPAAVVFASSASAYGSWPDNPLPLDEVQPPRPNRECHYAQQKLLAERMCLGHGGPPGRPRCVVVRLAAVLGPHADARVASRVHAYRLAVPAILDVAQAVQWLDEDDAVTALLAAGDACAQGMTGEIVNVATADWLDAQAAARIAGSRVVRLPRSAVMATSELVRRLHLAPFGADRACLIGGPLALSIGKAERFLGWAPHHSSAEVLAAALERDWRGAPANRRCQ